MIQHTLHCIKCVRGRSCGQRLSALIYGLWIIIILELWAPNMMLNFYNKPDLSWYGLGSAGGAGVFMWHITQVPASVIPGPSHLYCCINSMLIFTCHHSVGCWSAADCVQPHYTSDYVSCCWDQSHSGEWLVSLAPDKNRKPVKSKIHIPCFYRYQSATDLFILFFSVTWNFFASCRQWNWNFLWD